jgi:hypothetical protein
VDELDNKKQNFESILVVELDNNKILMGFYRMNKKIEGNIEDELKKT